MRRHYIPTRATITDTMFDDSGRYPRSLPPPGDDLADAIVALWESGDQSLKYFLDPNYQALTDAITTAHERDDLILRLHHPQDSTQDIVFRFDHPRPGNYETFLMERVRTGDSYTAEVVDEKGTPLFSHRFTKL